MMAYSTYIIIRYLNYNRHNYGNTFYLTNTTRLRFQKRKNKIDEEVALIKFFALHKWVCKFENLNSCAFALIKISNFTN